MGENRTKWEFEFLDGPLQGKTQSIYDGLVVGRHSDCDLQIRKGHLSRRHAKFVCDSNGLGLVDLDSSNGTFVNGKKIHTHTVQAGDRITFDEISLIIIEIESFIDATEMFEPVQLGAQHQHLGKDPAPALAWPDQHSQGPALMGFSPPYENRIFPLSGGKITIGSAAKNDIVIDDDTVSSTHAHLIEEKKGWKIVNLLSANGTFVNNRKIQTAALSNGDQVGFGALMFHFYAAPSLELGNTSSSGVSAGKLLRIFVTSFTFVAMSIAAVVYAYYEYY